MAMTIPTTISSIYGHDYTYHYISLSDFPYPQLFLCLPILSQALRSLFTSRNTGIGRKGRWLNTEDLETYLYTFSQPGALTGALNYFRNVFR